MLSKNNSWRQSEPSAGSENRVPIASEGHRLQSGVCAFTAGSFVFLCADSLGSDFNALYTDLLHSPCLMCQSHGDLQKTAYPSLSFIFTQQMKQKLLRKCRNTKLKIKGTLSLNHFKIMCFISIYTVTGELCAVLARSPLKNRFQSQRTSWWNKTNKNKNNPLKLKQKTLRESYLRYDRRFRLLTSTVLQ